MAPRRRVGVRLVFSLAFGGVLSGCGAGRAVRYHDRMTRSLVGTIVSVLAVTSLLAQVKKEDLDGARNFTLVDGTTACAGATEPRAMAAIAARGYRAVINLRVATESGAAIEESRAAAEAAGLTFIHLPFNAAAPDMTVADAFLKAVTDKAHQPVYIHCASGQRAGALWLVKRMLVDKWPKDKALEEAHAIGLTTAPLEQFALDYVAARSNKAGSALGIRHWAFARSWRCQEDA